MDMLKVFLQCFHISDYPAFLYRGMCLDVNSFNDYRRDDFNPE
ncbi:MAG: hypothetical protein ACLFN2_07970 [Bacteroidales bacterium]